MINEKITLFFVCDHFCLMFDDFLFTLNLAQLSVMRVLLYQSLFYVSL